MKDTRHLYQISDTMAQLLEAEEVDVEALDKVATEFSEKTASIGRFIQYLRDSTGPLKARAQTFLEEVSRREKRVEWLLDYLDRNMVAAGAEKIEAEGVVVKYRKLPDRVDVPDDAAVPAEYIRVIPEQYVADKKALLEALKAGNEIPGAVLITGRRKLEVK